MNRLPALVVLLVAIASCRPKEAPPRYVWVVNELDVPLNVAVNGKTIRVAEHSHGSVQTKDEDLQFVAKTLDGVFVDRAAARPGPAMKVAYNVHGAALFQVNTHTYGPIGSPKQIIPTPSRDEEIRAQKIVQRNDISLFLDPAPAVLRSESDDRGPEEHKSLRVIGDWRSTMQLLRIDGRMDEAWALARAVAAAEPDEPDAKIALRTLNPPARRAPGSSAPPPPPPRPMFAPEPELPPAGTWQKSSHDNRAMVEEIPDGAGGCKTRCEIGGTNVWTTNQCLSAIGDFRATTSDCERLIVVRGLPRGLWRYTPVVFIYQRGQIEKSMTASDYITDEQAIQVRDDGGFQWIKGNTHFSSDQTGVQFVTADGRNQHISFR